MKINKKQLQEALEKVKPGLANKELIAQTTSFAFIKGRVVTYDDRISISHPVEGLELEGAIQAEGLYKFLGKVKKDEVDLEINGNEIQLISGRSKATFTLQTEIKLPLDQDIAERGEWIELPDNFIKAVQFVIPACAKDSTVCNSIHIQNDGYIVATDNYRVARYNIGEDIPTKTFLMPVDSAIEVVKLNPIRFADGQKWIHFETEDGTVISCRTVEDKFPNVIPLLDVKGPQLEFPKSIDDILERAMVFAKRDHILEEFVEISIDKHIFKMIASSDTSSFEEEANIKYDGRLSFKIVPYLLKGILSETLFCTKGDNRLKFEGENWIYVSALIN